MRRPELTPTQAEALRLLVEHARARDHGLRLGRTTDTNMREINGRVAKALAGHGLVEVRTATSGEVHPVGAEVAHATEAGRSWILDPIAEASEQIARPVPPARLDDAARAELEAAARADFLEEQRADDDGMPNHPDSPDDDTAVDTAEPSEEVIQTDEGAAEDGEPDAAPTSPEPRAVDDTYEGRIITGFESRILAAHRDAVRGSIPARHLGDRIVAVVVMHVDQVQHDNLADGDLQRTQKLRPTTVYPLPDVYADGFRSVAAQLLALADQQQTLFADETAGGDVPQDLVDRLERAELEARDEDGRRDWTEADEARLQQVRDAIADGDWHPARQFGRDAVRRLHRAGEVEVQPEWWVTGGDPGMEPEQAAEVIPHVRLAAGTPSEQPTKQVAPEETMRAAVDDLLDTAERLHPEIHVGHGKDGWTVHMPAGMDDQAPTGGPWMLPDAAMQAVDRIVAIKEWRQPGHGLWIGTVDLDAAIDDDQVPF